jgi:phosphoesterase RecJ-like protein
MAGTICHFMTPADFLKPALDALNRASTLWLFSHVRPDGDALGSSLGLAGALQAAGKSVRVFNQDPVPDLLAFLPGASRVEPMPSSPPDAATLLVALDTSTLPRLGPAFQAWNTPPALNIDHHESNTQYASLNCVDPGEPSTASLVWRLVRAAGWPLDADAASHLYVGLMTDTGSFRYRGTTAATLRCAADLVQAGADPAALAQACYQSISPARFSLRRAALRDLRMECGGRLSIIDLTPQSFAETGATAEDTEGLVEEALTVRGVEIAALFELKNNGALKVSLRSKGRANVSTLAQAFGGGGHPGAAGINFAAGGPGHREAILEKLRSLFPAS